MLSPKFVTANAKRILIRAPNWIGDAVMAMPAVQRLRELEPSAFIALLCPAKLSDLWLYNPYLNEVIPFDPEPDLVAVRERDFDVAVIFPNSFRSAWEAHCAHIPSRVGYPGHWRRWLLTDVAPSARNDRPIREEIEIAGQRFDRKRFASTRHQVHHYLDLIGFLGGNREPIPPKIWANPAALTPLAKFFRADGREFIGINAGAEYGPAKRWPAERFAEAATRIAHEHDFRWLVFGGRGDTETAAVIENILTRAGLSVVNVAGKTSLLDLFALLKVCRLLLTNDTGPMHIAAALDVPLIAIFGSTSPELTGPLGSHSLVIQEKVDCNPCFLRECPIDFRCMNRVTVDRVTDAALKRL